MIPWPGAGTQAVSGSVAEIRELEAEAPQPRRREYQRIIVA